MQKLIKVRLKLPHHWDNAYKTVRNKLNEMKAGGTDPQKIRGYEEVS
jgi:hypothetical protein